VTPSSSYSSGIPYYATPHAPAAHKLGEIASVNNASHAGCHEASKSVGQTPGAASFIQPIGAFH